jgi:hypothetical protein
MRDGEVFELSMRDAVKYLVERNENRNTILSIHLPTYLSVFVSSSDYFTGYKFI